MKGKKTVVKLHPVQEVKEKSQPLVNDGNKKNELDNIRLKKATKAPTVSITNRFTTPVHALLAKQYHRVSRLYTCI